MEQLRIAVTAEDIAYGVGGDRKYCPIARATRRLGKKQMVRVGEDYLMLGTKQFVLPDSAINFIDNFDDCGQGRPFKFTAKRYQDKVA